MPSLFERLTGGFFRRGLPIVVRSDPKQKAYAVGQAAVPAYESSFGHDQTTFTPAQYGDYLALNVAVYACVNKRAKSLAKLPPKLYKVSASGTKTEVTQGKAFALLQSVNPFWSWGRLIRMTVSARLLWGVSYWCLERGVSGSLIPKEIWWTRPDRMKVIPHPKDYISGFVYESGGTSLPWKREEVIWLPLDNPIDEYSGLSPIAAARLSIDLGNSSLRSNKNIFDQGLQLGGVITPADKDVTFTDAQSAVLEEQFARRFKGVDKAHRWAVLGGDVKVTPLGISPKDAEFLNLMRWSLNDVARVYDIPPEMVGDHEHATYSNIEQAQEHYWDTVITDSTEIAEGLTEQFLPIFKEADLLEFDASQIAALQEDRGKLVEQMNKLWAMGVPLNPLLQEFQPQLLPIGKKGYEWGDVWWAPGTLTPILGKPEPPPPAPEPPLLPEPQPPEPPVDDTPTEPTPEQPSSDEGPTPATQAGKALSLLGQYAEEEAVVDPLAERVESVLRELFRRQQDSVIARLRSRKTRANERYTPSNINDAFVPFDQAHWGKEFKQALYPFVALIYKRTSPDAFDDDPELVRFAEGKAQREARAINLATYDALALALSQASEAVDKARLVREVYQRIGSLDFARALVGVPLPPATKLQHATSFSTERKARAEALRQFPRLVDAIKELAAPRLKAEIDDYMDDQRKRVKAGLNDA